MYTHSAWSHRHASTHACTHTLVLPCIHCIQSQTYTHMHTQHASAHMHTTHTHTHTHTLSLSLTHTHTHITQHHRHDFRCACRHLVHVFFSLLFLFVFASVALPGQFPNWLIKLILECGTSIVLTWAGCAVFPCFTSFRESHSRTRTWSPPLTSKTLNGGAWQG